MSLFATKTITNILNIPFDEHKTTKAEFYPYLAYINPKGNPDNLLFDNFMFDISSGETLADWESNVNLLLDAQSGMPALDSAAADVKAILNLSGSKVFGVYLKAPVPKISLTPFGDINRDGIIEKLLDTEDCLKAFSVFMSDFIRQLSIYRFENLIIKGWVLEDCEDTGISSAMESYLTNLGYKVLSSDIENLKITPETDFSQIMVNNPKARVFYGEAPKFIINCAFSEKNELRTVYDSLYILLNSDKFISNDDREVKPTYAPSSTIVDKGEEPINEATEAFTDELIEELFEDISETEDSFADDGFEEDEIDGITEEISVEISITESKSQPQKEETQEKKQCGFDCLTKKQKRALVGAGIAAAALGLVYIIGKTSKD